MTTDAYGPNCWKRPTLNPACVSCSPGQGWGNSTSVVAPDNGGPGTFSTSSPPATAPIGSPARSAARRWDPQLRRRTRSPWWFSTCRQVAVPPSWVPPKSSQPMKQQLRSPEGQNPSGPRVLRRMYDGVDRVLIERSIVVDPVLNHALRHLRSVKSQRPFDTGSVEFADWRESIAEALDALARVLVFEEDRARAGAEATAAREQGAEVRRRVRSGLARTDTACGHPDGEVAGEVVDAG